MPESQRGSESAPPKSSQPGRPGIFRRLSALRSSSFTGRKRSRGPAESASTLVLDQNGNACSILALDRAQLKRVSFYVDVEVAPTPVYANIKLAAEPTNKVAKLEDLAQPIESVEEAFKVRREEREVRRKKQRLAAEEHGLVPVEVHKSNSNSSLESSRDTRMPSARNTTTRPTTDAVRVYRRCCQLRETPILKKITTQLMDTANLCPTTGAVKRLDLTNYRLQLPEIIALSDYLAIFPVMEIVLENCGLNDEGLRIILAGLLAAKQLPSSRTQPENLTPKVQGVVERVVLNNNEFGPDGWKHISLFSDTCGSLKDLDISQVALPKEIPRIPDSGLQCSKQVSPGDASGISRVIAQFLETLERPSISKRLPDRSQMSGVVEGMMRCSVYRLGV